MNIVPLDDGFGVSGQLAPGDFATLAASGVRMVVNNRPDNEEPGQLSAAEGAQLAAAHGLAYRHIPIRMPSLSQADIAALSAALAEAGGPVVAHCKSGARSAFVWGIEAAGSGRITTEALLARGREIGMDFSPALGWLARNPPG